VDSTQETGFRPPYLSFQTFWSFLEELLSRPLPGKLDRSVMRKKSGSDQANLAVALKSFGLIDESWTVTGLNELAKTDTAGRIQWLALQIREHYAAQMKVSDDNGTEQQLRDSFKEAFGLESSDTIRKAMTFFLHAAKKADIETSHYFPSTRSGSGAPGTPKPRRASGRRKPAPDDAKKPDLDAGTTEEAANEHRDVTLGTAGTVSIDVKVKWLDLSDDQFTKLRKLIKDIEALGDSGPDRSEQVEVSP
jgi:hypothetical protein